MGKLILEIKRPDEATPEQALALIKEGVKPAQLAKAWGISRAYIYYLLHKAGWSKDKA